ncbi:MAG: hypothetical protein FWE25_09165 [Lachnospiraceae bacterium]|nr:hypothetical protein [Lachnospiraceae bacterium]
MNKTQKRHSSLFLIELMAALLFFSLAAAICIQLFVHSHLLNQRATNLNEAIIISQNLAETFRATKGYSGELTFYYDENWEPTYIGLSQFTAQIHIHETETGVRIANIIVYEAANAPIYTLEVMITP